MAHHKSALRSVLAWSTIFTTAVERNMVEATFHQSLNRIFSFFHPSFLSSQDVYQYSFKKSWFSDASTYPLIVVMAVATSVMVGMSANALLRYKGVKLSAERKNAILNEWDSPTERQTTVTDVIGSHPIGMNSSRYRSLKHGGLGVEDWNKE